jgi:aminoglycoside phosphotransferase (APT) family kinase protein
MRGGTFPFAGFVEYLVARFGPEAREAVVAPLDARATGIKQGGYGVPYRVSWKAGAATRTLVLETVRPGPFGHEDRSDRAGILLRAYDEFGSLARHVAAVDIGAFREDGPAVSLGGTGEFFILTDFVEGEPYASDFDRVADSGRVGALDRARVEALAGYLADLHREPVAHPSWYRRRLRELVGSGECLAGVADSYPACPGFVDAALLERVERLALAWRYRLRDRTERLRAIHGDFHPWNILFRSGTDFTVLDRSRGALGDPADDVASLSLNFLFYSLRTRGDFVGPFSELLRLFWGRYLERSGDTELAAVVAPHLAFRALVVANPLWYPHEPEALRRQLFRFLLSVLEADRFEIERIPEYLARGAP